MRLASRTALPLVTLAFAAGISCAGPAPPASPEERQATILAARLADLDADLARIAHDGTSGDYAPVAFEFTSRDEAHARTLAAEIESSTPYPVQVRPPESAEGPWLVVGTTPILPNERDAHAPILRVMTAMGLRHESELRSWRLGPPPA